MPRLTPYDEAVKDGHPLHSRCSSATATAVCGAGACSPRPRAGSAIIPSMHLAAAMIARQAIERAAGRPGTGARSHAQRHHFPATDCSGHEAEREASSTVGQRRSRLSHDDVVSPSFTACRGRPARSGWVRWWRVRRAGEAARRGAAGAPRARGGRGSAAAGANRRDRRQFRRQRRLARHADRPCRAHDDHVEIPVRRLLETAHEPSPMERITVASPSSSRFPLLETDSCARRSPHGRSPSGSSLARWSSRSAAKSDVMLRQPCRRWAPCCTISAKPSLKEIAQCGLG